MINEDIEKRLRRKFKRSIPRDRLDDDMSWSEILEEWYEENKRDPWPKVMAALEGSELDGTEDVVKLIQEKHLQLQHC